MAFESKRNLRPPNRVPLRRVEGVSKELSEVQRNVDEATRAARDMPQSKGKRITGSFDGTNDLALSHGLGRKPRGFNVEEQDATGTIKFVSSDSRTITLNASAAMEAKLWVY